MQLIIYVQEPSVSHILRSYNNKTETRGYPERCYVPSVLQIPRTGSNLCVDNKSRQVLNWLSTLAGNYETKHDEVVRRRVSNTGKWLLELSEFQEFMQNSEGPRLLWCHGLPGAGKTVLS
jgi:hypothetical protein